MEAVHVQQLYLLRWVQRGTKYLTFLFNRGKSFFSFRFFLSELLLKEKYVICWWWESNTGHLMSEATTPPTEPPPLTSHKVFFLLIIAVAPAVSRHWQWVWLMNPSLNSQGHVKGRVRFVQCQKAAPIFHASNNRSIPLKSFFLGSKVLRDEIPIAVVNSPF